MIAFTVRGLPAPQGSKRLLPLRARRGGRPIMVESSKRVPKWRAAVAAAAQAAIDLLPADEQRRVVDAVAVTLDFCMPRPKAHFGTGRNASLLRAGAPVEPIGKPDLDKLTRAVLDALTGVAWVDDAQVTDLVVAKRFAPRPDQVGVHVRVDTRLQRRDAAEED